MFSKILNVRSYGKICLLVLTASFWNFLPIAVQANEVIASQNITQLVNINSANLSELASLKGIGQQKALAIIAYRDQMGGFNSVDELLKVKGIGDKVLAGIKNKITL